MHKSNQPEQQHHKGQNMALDEGVAVAIAEDMELAGQYRDVLEQNGIPASIGSEKQFVGELTGVAVIVPQDCLDDAVRVIETQQAFDDFLDFSFNNRDDEDEMDDEFYGDYDGDDPDDWLD